MTGARVTRRTLLVTSAAIGASFALSGLLSPGAKADGGGLAGRLRKLREQVRRRDARLLTGATSRNGWPMEKVVDGRGHIYTRPVPGVPASTVTVRMGDVETVLVHVVRRFHYEVEGLRDGDVVGWRPPSSVRRSSPQSDQGSGTAVQIRPGHYPVGARGGFFPAQLAVIRDILAELRGAVRWGGDDAIPDEALFALAVGPDDPLLAAVAGTLRGWQDDPARGAGSEVDVAAPARRRAAEALARRQRRRAP